MSWRFRAPISLNNAFSDGYIEIRYTKTSPGTTWECLEAEAFGLKKSSIVSILETYELPDHGLWYGSFVRHDGQYLSNEFRKNSIPTHDNLYSKYQGTSTSLVIAIAAIASRHIIKTSILPPQAIYVWATGDILSHRDEVIESVDLVRKIHLIHNLSEQSRPKHVFLIPATCRTDTTQYLSANHELRFNVYTLKESGIAIDNTECCYDECLPSIIFIPSSFRKFVSWFFEEPKSNTHLQHTALPSPPPAEPAPTVFAPPNTARSPSTKPVSLKRTLRRLRSSTPPRAAQPRNRLWRWIILSIGLCSLSFITYRLTRRPISINPPPSSNVFRVLLAGDRSDAVIASTHSRLQTKFQAWYAEYRSRMASQNIRQLPELEFVYSTGLSDSRLRDTSSVLGISGITPLGTVSQGIVLQDATLQSNFEPIVRRIDTPRSPLRFLAPWADLRGRTRITISHIDYRPDDLFFQLTEVATPVERQEPHDEGYVARGSANAGMQVRINGSPLILQNLNISRWSELAVFERATELFDLPRAVYSTASLREEELHDTFITTLHTWVTMPSASFIDDNNSHIRQLVFWLERDTSVGSSHSIPGPLLGNLRRLHAELVLLSVNRPNSVCRDNAPTDLQGDPRALEVVSRYCSREKWPLVSEAYLRAADTQGYVCPMCYILSAQAQLMTENFEGASRTLQQATERLPRTTRTEQTIRARLLAGSIHLSLMSPESRIETAIPLISSQLNELRACGFQGLADFEEARILLGQSQMTNSNVSSPMTTNLRQATSLLESIVHRYPNHRLAKFLLTKALLAQEASPDQSQAISLLNELTAPVNPTPENLVELLGDADLVMYSINTESVIADLVDYHRLHANCREVQRILARWEPHLTRDAIQRIMPSGNAVRSWYIFPARGLAPNPRMIPANSCGITIRPTHPS